MKTTNTKTRTIDETRTRKTFETITTTTIYEMYVCEHTGLLYFGEMPFTVEQIARIKKRRLKQTKQLGS